MRIARSHTQLKDSPAGRPAENRPSPGRHLSHLLGSPRRAASSSEPGRPVSVFQGSRGRTSASIPPVALGVPLLGGELDPLRVCWAPSTASIGPNYSFTPRKPAQCFLLRYVASRWRRTNSTIACSVRLREKTRVQRRSSVVRLSRARIAGEILRDFAAQAQADSFADPAVP
jgi:hypothetical protein